MVKSLAQTVPFQFVTGKERNKNIEFLHSPAAREVRSYSGVVMEF